MTMPSAQPSAQPSLYERLGGTYGIAGAVDVLVDRRYDNVLANQNPHVQASTDEGARRLQFLSTAWSIEKTDGPACYPGREMGPAHAHLKVTDDEFDVVATEIAATLYHVGVPHAEHKEFMAIVESYRAEVVGPAVVAVAEEPALV